MDFGEDESEPVGVETKIDLVKEELLDTDSCLECDICGENSSDKTVCVHRDIRPEVDAKIVIKDETYCDDPEYVPVDRYLLDIKLENLKEEPADNVEGSNEDLEQGSCNDIVAEGTEEAVFQCGVCLMSFSSAPSLKNHEKIHTGESPFICKVCSRSFSKKFRLKYHSAIHLEEKPFKCKLCTRAFNHKTALTKHEWLHDDKKMYKCKECPEFFVGSVALAEHSKTHLGTYQCKLCPKTYKFENSLIAHERKHRGKVPYICKRCPETFTTKLAYTDHNKKIHWKQKEYQCNLCYALSVNTASLKLHMKRFHDESI